MRNLIAAVSRDNPSFFMLFSENEAAMSNVFDTDFGSDLIGRGNDPEHNYWFDLNGEVGYEDYDEDELSEIRERLLGWSAEDPSEEEVEDNNTSRGAGFSDDEVEELAALGIDVDDLGSSSDDHVDYRSERSPAAIHRFNQREFLRRRRAGSVVNPRLGRNARKVPVRVRGILKLLIDKKERAKHLGRPLAELRAELSANELAKAA